MNFSISFLDFLEVLFSCVAHVLLQSFDPKSRLLVPLLLGKLRKEEMVPHANAFGEKVLLRPTRGPLGNASSLSLAPKSSWRRAKLRHKTQDKNSVYFDY